MATKFGRKLTDGLTARLEFDFTCNRGHSFGEYYLHGVINEIVSANIDPRMQKINANYRHDAIAHPEKLSGRPREIDFFVSNLTESEECECVCSVKGGCNCPCSNTNEYDRICAEVKWAGSSYAKPETVLRDVIRLALVKKSDPAVECLFVLAGGNRDVSNLLRALPIGAAKKNGAKLLQTPRAGRASRKRAFPLSVKGKPVSEVEKMKDTLPPMPEKLFTKLVTPAAAEAKRWQALVWKITIE